MFKILVDTCVWLDLAKDPKQHAILGVVEQMIREKLLTLIVPELVIDEFQRNRARIEKDSAKSLGTHFKLVKDALERSGGNKRKLKTVIGYLEDVDHKIPIVGGAASHVLDRMEKLLIGVPPVKTSDAAKLRAAQRAVDCRAPFHQGKNSMADALLIETYAECVKSTESAGTRFAFVTHNKSDFSVPGGNHKLPHPDMANYFSRIKSLYFVNLAECLRRVNPAFVSEVMLEYSFDQEPRGRQEILGAEDLLFHQVWYNRHWNLRLSIEAGQHRVVSREEWEANKDYQNTTIDEVWRGALQAAKAVEQRYGKKNLGPWTDFEWGMINGKLSALRWALGDDWDMLDT